MTATFPYLILLGRIVKSTEAVAWNEEWSGKLFPESLIIACERVRIEKALLTRHRSTASLSEIGRTDDTQV